jgi:hypothetical protein
MGSRYMGWEEHLHWEDGLGFWADDGSIGKMKLSTCSWILGAVIITTSTELPGVHQRLRLHGRNRLT